MLIYYSLMAACVWFVILAYAWHLSFRALGKHLALYDFSVLSLVISLCMIIYHCQERGFTSYWFFNARDSLSNCEFRMVMIILLSHHLIHYQCDRISV